MMELPNLRDGATQPPWFSYPTSVMELPNLARRGAQSCRHGIVRSIVCPSHSASRPLFVPTTEATSARADARTHTRTPADAEAHTPCLLSARPATLAGSAVRSNSSTHARMHATAVLQHESNA